MTKVITKIIEDEFSRETKNTPSEKLAKKIIDLVGSWTFLFFNLAIFAGWLLLNLNYNYLTFWVSLEAIVLTVLILIKANKDEASDRNRNIKDYKIDTSIAKRIKTVEKKIDEIQKAVIKK